MLCQIVTGKKMNKYQIRKVIDNKVARGTNIFLLICPHSDQLKTNEKKTIPCTWDRFFSCFPSFLKPHYFGQEYAICVQRVKNMKPKNVTIYSIVVFGRSSLSITQFPPLSLTHFSVSIDEQLFVSKDVRRDISP